MSKECRDCKFCWCECGEDIVCGHPKSNLASHGYGLSVNACRQADGPCGPDGELFQRITGLRELGKAGPIVTIKAVDSNAEALRPTRRWEERFYIDIKDQRVLGEFYEPNGQRHYIALVFPDGNIKALGRFTSMDRARRAVEAWWGPQEKKAGVTLRIPHTP